MSDVILGSPCRPGRACSSHTTLNSASRITWLRRDQVLANTTDMQRQEDGLAKHLQGQCMLCYMKYICSQFMLKNINIKTIAYK